MTRKGGGSRGARARPSQNDAGLDEGRGLPAWQQQTSAVSRAEGRRPSASTTCQEWGAWTRLGAGALGHLPALPCLRLPGALSLSPTPTPPSSSSWSPGAALAALPLRPQVAPAAQAVPSASNALPASASAAKTPPLVGTPQITGLPGAFASAPLVLVGLPAGTRALGPGTPSPQALAPWPRGRARVTEGMGDATRARARRKAAHRDGSPGGAEHSGQSGEGSTASPRPGRPASCPGPRAWPCWVWEEPCLAVPRLGWEPQGLHLPLPRTRAPPGCPPPKQRTRPPPRSPH